MAEAPDLEVVQEEVPKAREVGVREGLKHPEEVQEVLEEVAAVLVILAERLPLHPVQMCVRPVDSKNLI